jgi:hypothetical protein
VFRPGRCQQYAQCIWSGQLTDTVQFERVTTGPVTERHPPAPRNWAATTASLQAAQSSGPKPHAAVSQKTYDLLCTKTAWTRLGALLTCKIFRCGDSHSPVGKPETETAVLLVLPAALGRYTFHFGHSPSSITKPIMSQFWTLTVVTSFILKYVSETDSASLFRLNVLTWAQKSYSLSPETSNNANRIYKVSRTQRNLPLV